MINTVAADPMIGKILKGFFSDAVSALISGED